MITSNVFLRVFFIKESQYGTAFTIDVDGKQYLISAKHLFDVPSNTTEIQLKNREEWNPLGVRYVGETTGEADIVVFAPTKQLSPAFPLEPTMDQIAIGQDVFFVGFPYKLFTDAGEIIGDRAFPFIKKGILSTAFDSDDEVYRLYIDATNNEGFSGGPLIFTPLVSSTPQYRVAGVVSKFRVEYEEVLNEQMEKTGEIVPYNTGILVAYGIQNALNLISNNPIGVPLL